MDGVGEVIGFDLCKDQMILGCVMGDDVLALYKDIKPARLKLGEAVIFNPYAMHGAVAHDNRLSRIGLSTRFQSRKYPLFIRNSEFYYPYQLSVKQPDYASMFQKADEHYAYQLPE